MTNERIIKQALPQTYEFSKQGGYQQSAKVDYCHLAPHAYTAHVQPVSRTGDHSFFNWSLILYIDNAGVVPRTIKSDAGCHVRPARLYVYHQLVDKGASSFAVYLPSAKHC